MSIPVANLQLFLQSNKSTAQKMHFLCNTWRNTVLQDCVWEDYAVDDDANPYFTAYWFNLRNVYVLMSCSTFHISNVLMPHPWK